MFNAKAYSAASAPDEDRVSREERGRYPEELEKPAGR